MNSPKEKQIASKVLQSYEDRMLETIDPLLEDFISFNEDPPAVLLMRNFRRRAA